MKYEFTGETKVEFGITLKRIRRLSDGLVGGWLEKEANLSQEDEALVFGEARVFGEAQVSGEAWVFGEAQVSGEAWVFGEARVFGEALVFGRARVSGEALVFGEAQVSIYEHIKVVCGFRYTVTVTPQNVAAGCKVWTHTEVKALKHSEVAELISKTEFNQLKKIVLVLMQSVKGATQK